MRIAALCSETEVKKLSHATLTLGDSALREQADGATQCCPQLVGGQTGKSTKGFRVPTEGALGGCGFRPLLVQKADMT